MRALLDLFRPLVDEIVLAADTSGDPEILEACADLADKRFALDPAPLNRRLGWLQDQCTGQWILRFDDDESPSASLLASLGELTQRRTPMQFGMPRRWLFGSPARWIRQWPWTPDYQYRLMRNLPGAWRYPGRLHAPIEMLGELSLVECPIYHCELLLAGIAERRAKRDEYEARRPGLRNGEFPLNWFYTPEDWAPVETALTPADDLRLIELVRAGSAPPHAVEARAPVVPVSAEDAERFHDSREVSQGAYAARVRVVHPLNGTPPGSTQELAVDVTNLGDEFWPWGDHAPYIRFGYRWRSLGGETIVEGRALFTETVRPGQTTRVLANITAPEEPDSYRLELDVVHEAVRWFGQGVVLEVDVP